LKLTDVGPSYLQTSTGVETHKENSNFTVQVNSQNKTLVVNYKLPQYIKINLSIYRLDGSLVKNTMINPSEKQSIGISDLQNGIYLIRLNAGNYSESCKFIIK